MFQGSTLSNIATCSSFLVLIDAKILCVLDLVNKASLSGLQWWNSQLVIFLTFGLIS
jgi:hypothetical protein